MLAANTLKDNKSLQFAKQLQTEIADVVGDRPVKVTLQMFIDLVAITDDGNELKISKDKALEIQEELVADGYVKKGELTEKYFNDKRDGTLDLSDVNDLKGFIVSPFDTVFNPSAIKPEEEQS